MQWVITIKIKFIMNPIYISREKKNVDKNKDIINDISEVKNLEENDVKEKQPFLPFSISKKKEVQYKKNENIFKLPSKNLLENGTNYDYY